MYFVSTGRSNSFAYEVELAMTCLSVFEFRLRAGR